MSVEIARPEQLRAQLELRLPRYLSTEWANLALRNDSTYTSATAAARTEGSPMKRSFFDVEWLDGDRLCRRGLVLRLQPEGHRMFLMAMLVKEGRLLEDFTAETSVPVPEVIAVEADPQILGRPFFLIEHVLAGHVPGGRPSIHRDPWLGIPRGGPASRALAQRPPLPRDGARDRLADVAWAGGALWFSLLA